MASQNVIKCSKCKAAKGTTNVRLKKLIKQYGGKRKLNAGYVCRSCKSGAAPVKGKIVKIKAKKKKRKTKKIPKSKVICSKCHVAFGSTKARIEKLSVKFGSLEELQTNYVCTKCRKEHNCDCRGRLRKERKKRKPKLHKEGEQYVLPQSLRFQGDAVFGPEQEYCPRPEGMPVAQYNKIMREHVDDCIKRGTLVPVGKAPSRYKPTYKVKKKTKTKKKKS